MSKRCTEESKNTRKTTLKNLNGTHVLLYTYIAIGDFNIMAKIV